MMKPIDNSQLLSQMRSMAQAAGIEPVSPQVDFSNAKVNSGGFGDLLGRAINSVNAAQQEAGMLATKVVSGDDGASLVQSMIASQKANISFQAALQVRNKVSKAYQDIMNMPI